MDRTQRERAAAALFAPHPAGAERLRRVLEGGGVFVTTGQQPGLLTGPLYAVYKALSAIRLADALEGILGRPVAPLFWIASEDHDWAEVDHTHLIDRENGLHRVALPSPPVGTQDRPIFRCTLDRGIEAVLAQVEKLLPASDFVGADLELLRGAWTPGRTLAEGFRDTLGELLGHRGLLMVDAADPVLKELSLPLLLEEAIHGEAGERELARVAGVLEREGLEVQVAILEGGVNLFLEGPAGRERMYRENGHFRLRRSGLRVSRDELRDRVREDPRVLSPNVLLRPVVESWVFPVVATVLGPGETAYWGQLREYFQLRGLAMPVVTPRGGATLVEAKVRKVLERWNLEVESLARPTHELLSELLREEIPPAIREALGEYRGGVARSAGRLLRAVREVDPTLSGPVEAARNQTFMALDEVERKVMQALRRRNEVAAEQLAKASVHLHPGGRPQERMLNLFYYTARYGRGLLDALGEHFRPPLPAGGALPLPRKEG